jgi:type IV pilus assembly protein PilF
MQLGDFKLAEESFRRAMALDPNDAGVVQNYGWLQCQSGRFGEATDTFNQALANPQYRDRAKTYLTMGLCQSKAGHAEEAERSLLRSYELDAGNPITSELANAESLWLGIKVERRLDSAVAMQQLVEQLKKRFPQARELSLYERGAFDD